MMIVVIHGSGMLDFFVVIHKPKQIFLLEHVHLMLNQLFYVVEVVDVVYIALVHYHLQQFMKFYTGIINFTNIYICTTYINTYYAR